MPAVYMQKATQSLGLQLGHGSNVGGLDVVLVLLNSGLQIIERNLVILDNQVDLQLLDTVTNWDPGVSTPHKTVHLNLLDVSQHLLEVGLVVPWLDVKGNERLSSWLRLGGLLGVVFGKSLLLQLLSLFVNLLIVRTEKVDVTVVILLSGSWSRLSSWQGREVVHVQVDVGQPSDEAWVLLLNGLEGGNIGLGWGGSS